MEFTRQTTMACTQLFYVKKPSCKSDEGFGENFHFCASHSLNNTTHFIDFISYGDMFEIIFDAEKIVTSSKQEFNNDNVRAIVVHRFENGSVCVSLKMNDMSRIKFEEYKYVPKQILPSMSKINNINIRMDSIFSPYIEMELISCSDESTHKISIVNNVIFMGANKLAVIDMKNTLFHNMKHVSFV